MNQFAITVMSRDRVGIVRDVANRITALQGNIHDLSQTVVSGYFTMILVAEFPAGDSSASIKQALYEINQQRNPDEPALELAVMEMSEHSAQQQVSAEDIYMLTASGVDRIGFVADVAHFCAENSINILDLATLVNEGQYMMILQVDLSRCTSLKAIHRKLQQFIQTSNIRMVLQHNDIFEATHAVNMPK